MTTRSITTVRRAAACFVLAGAGLGVASGGAAWAATPLACGTAAHPALYSTTHHAAVSAVTHEETVIDTAHVPGQAAVAEVSHLELAYVDGDGTPEGGGWSASGRTQTIEDSAAYTDHAWQRTVVDRAAVAGSPAVPAVTHEETVVDEAAYDETVVDSPAVPAVDEVFHLVTVVDKPAYDETVVDVGGYAYQQKQTGKITYKDTAFWNGEDIDPGKDLGWVRVARLDRTHVEHHEAETHTEKVVDSPAVPGVPAVTHVVHHEAVTSTVTVVDVPAVPAVEAVEELSHVETGWTRDPSVSPEGDGWSLTGEQVHHEATSHVRHEWVRTVVDVPATPAVPEVLEVSHTVTVVDVAEIPAWDEQVLVSAATPAGPACLPGAEAPTATRGGSAAAAVSADPASVPTQVALAQTGSDLTVALGAGLAFVVVGGMLVAAGRKQHA